MGLFGEDLERLHRRLGGFGDAVVASFNNVKRDITMQNQWISHLNNTHEDLKSRHDAHRNLTTAELHKLRSWINHLHENGKKQERDLENLKTMMTDALNTYNRHITELYNLAQREETDIEKLKHAVRKDIMPELKLLIEAHKAETGRLLASHSEALDRKVDQMQSQMHTGILSDVANHLSSFRNETEAILGRHRDEGHEALKTHKEATEELLKSHKEATEQLLDSHKQATERLVSEKIEAIPAVKEIQMVPKPSLLTYPEQKLLNLMLNETDPVTYEQIAQKTGHSINTVRVIMNSLKKRNLIEEHLLPSGIKLFNARNKERIKKIYNLDYL